MPNFAIAMLLLALATQYAVAALAFPLLSRRSRVQVSALALAVALLLSCPLLIPPAHIQLRALAVFLAADASFRMADFARCVRGRHAVSVSWGTYYRFLNPFPSLVVLFNWRARRCASGVSSSKEWLRFAMGCGLFAAMLMVTLSCRSIPLLRENFWLDHVIKMALFTVAIESLSQALLGLERLAGFDTLPIVNFAFLARTPAEFWYRYNQRVRAWLTANVFLPSGGLRHPVRGICATFAFSAAFHEVAFDIATSRVDGSQAAFFLLQAPAVIASRALERFAARWGTVGEITIRALTLTWLVVTSVLFFRGVERVFPFVYAGDPYP
ncbi:MAG: acyl-CoA acyltransferase [Planctomycetia bacterium]|nr:acyl-CoA acyltransferase [Planctomycetia bacterium]